MLLGHRTLNGAGETIMPFPCNPTATFNAGDVVSLDSNGLLVGGVQGTGANTKALGWATGMANDPTEPALQQANGVNVLIGGDNQVAAMRFTGTAPVGALAETGDYELAVSGTSQTVNYGATTNVVFRSVSVLQNNATAGDYRCEVMIPEAHCQAFG